MLTTLVLLLTAPVWVPVLVVVVLLVVKYGILAITAPVWVPVAIVSRIVERVRLPKTTHETWAEKVARLEEA